MTDHDLNNIERLIVRKLDGELSPEQSLELDRELLRNPDARQLFEDYKKIDALATNALGEAYDSITPQFEMNSLPLQADTHFGSSKKRYGWLIVGAVAAAILALIIPVPSLQINQSNSPQVVNKSNTTTPLPMGDMRPVMTQPSSQDGMMNYVDWRQPRIQRDNGREIIGVRGDDGNLYWIEVNRVRTIRKPRQRMVPAKEWGQM